MFDIVITQQAEQDMQDAVDWWRTNRYSEQADSWFVKILAAIDTLSRMPERCRIVQGADHLGREVRQLLFGIRSKPTHRIYFGVSDQTVTIYRVLHTSQDT